MTVQECERKLDRSLLHQFTTERAAVIVSAYRPYPNDDDYDPCYFVFDDEKLSGICPAAFGPTSHTKTLGWVEMVMAGTSTDVDLERDKGGQRSSGEGGNLGPLPWILLPLWPVMAVEASIERASAKSSVDEVVYQFDTELLRPGVNRENVHSSMGMPQKVVVIDDKHSLELYGNVPRRDDEQLRSPFQCVAIRYAGNLIEAVLSNDFIDKEWMD